jgi:hypothetical protein
MSDYRSIWEDLGKPKQEKKMTDKEMAVDAATKSGAVQAWLCGQDIQWRVTGQTVWKDFDKGGGPDFTVLTTEWRPSPIKVPEVNWFKLTDVEPSHGQRILITNGQVVRLHCWKGAGWRDTGTRAYRFWSPLPKPARVQ